MHMYTSMASFFNLFGVLGKRGREDQEDVPNKIRCLPKTINTNPKVSDIFQEVNKALGDGELHESDSCLGHSFAELVGANMIHPEEILTDKRDGIKKNTLPYLEIVRYFSERDILLPVSFRRKDLTFFNARTISVHSTTVCAYRTRGNKHGEKVILWYYNPWGYEGDIQDFYEDNEKKNAEIQDQIRETLQERNIFGKYKHDEEGNRNNKEYHRDQNLKNHFNELITKFNRDDRVTMLSLINKYPKYKDETVLIYAKSMLLFTSPPFVEIEFNQTMSESPYSDTKQNIIIEVMIILKILYNRVSYDILTMKDSMAPIGNQSKYQICTNNKLSKLVNSNTETGSCGVWTFLYTRMVQGLLEGIHSHEDVIKIVKEVIPNVLLLGEDSVQSLMGKIFILNKLGLEMFNLMRHFYENLPLKNKNVKKQLEFQEKVVKAYDEVKDRITETDPAAGKTDKGSRVEEVFDPQRESHRVPLIMEFVKKVVSKNISQSSLGKIREGVVMGGFITKSEWLGFLGILVFVINCKHSMQK